MKANTESISENLRRDGIVVVEDYLEESTCDDFRKEIESRLSDGMKTSELGMGYSDLANAGEPIVDQRSGDRDDGMLDIFNMYLAVPELKTLKEDDFIQDVISKAAQEPYTADNLNIYVNRSVTNTRDYHADTYAGKYKAFVYLTDVPNDAYGPFSYVKESHRAALPETSGIRIRFREFVNEKIRGVPSTNAVFHKSWNVKTCTAPKGTLIIANQAGLHRGMPQEEGKERMLVSTSYTQDG
jgi:hypothetical protein